MVDNAPYHNVVEENIPTKSSRKGEMQAWLTKHNIDWEPKDLKRELFQKIQSVGAQKRFVIDSLARHTGHTVLRLPVAHCELNPIELVWAQVKDFARKRNKTFRLADVEKLVPAAFEEVTPEHWKRCCEHAIKEEERFWRTDGLQEEAIYQFLIDLGVDDSDDDDEHEDVEGTVSDDEEMDEDDRRLLADAQDNYAGQI